MPQQNNGPRILTLDIETAPLESYTWGLWKQNVGLNQIKTEWSALSYSGKWLGNSRVVYRDNRGRADVRDDSQLLIELHALLDEADIVIAQNGLRFDLRKIRARMIVAGLPPFSPVRVVDTMVEAKKLFAFTSNRLAWLSDYLSDTKKSEHKKFPGFELWLECLADNPAAWEEMRKYNIVDVRATEKVYLRMRPWIEQHPNVAAYYADELVRCPKCGSVHVHDTGRPALTQTGSYTLLKCDDCGGYSRTRYTQNTLSKRKSLLAN